MSMRRSVVTEVLASRLIVVKGECDTKIITLGKGKHVLGKLPDADTDFESIYVSSIHAVVFEEKGCYKVFDGNGWDTPSTNGTSVNGKKVVEQGQTLDDNDNIELAGGEVILRFSSRVGTVVKPEVVKVPTKKGLVVDEKTRKVYVDEQLVLTPLTAMQFDILQHLYSRKGDACSLNDIYGAGWRGNKVGRYDWSIQQAIHRIREVVEPSPSAPQYIITIRGFGYRLDTFGSSPPKT